MMPGTDGIETCRLLREFTDAYIVMLTARADEVDKLVGLSIGADDYMVKPFSPRELVACSCNAPTTTQHSLGVIDSHI